MSSGKDFGFWDGLLKESYLSGDVDSMNMFLDDAVETRMSSKEIGENFEQLRGLTDKGRAIRALTLPVLDGSRVAFNSNLGVVLSLEDMPEHGMKGTVVSVRSASGDVTSYEGNVFVEWDDGQFRSVNAQYLLLLESPKKAEKIRVSSLGDLTDFLKVSKDALVHKSTKDIWSFKQEGDEFVIERLLGEDGTPLKG